MRRVPREVPSVRAGDGVDAAQGRASARSEADRPQGSGRKAKEARGLTGINGGTGEGIAAPASPF